MSVSVPGTGVTTGPRAGAGPCRPAPRARPRSGCGPCRPTAWPRCRRGRGPAAPTRPRRRCPKRGAQPVVQGGAEAHPQARHLGTGTEEGGRARRGHGRIVGHEQPEHAQLGGDPLGRGAVPGRLHRGEGLQAAPEHLGQEVVLGGEVGVGRGRRHAGPAGHGAHRHALVARGPRLVGGRLHQLLHHRRLTRREAAARRLGRRHRQGRLAHCAASLTAPVRRRGGRGVGGGHVGGAVAHGREAERRRRGEARHLRDVGHGKGLGVVVDDHLPPAVRHAVRRHRGGRWTWRMRALGFTAWAVTSKVPSSMVWHMPVTMRSPHGSTSMSAPQLRARSSPGGRRPPRSGRPCSGGGSRGRAGGP